jgi:ABC-type branched-subunit amino acid transport system permease subunit
LAIVTLFVLEIFVNLATNVDRIRVPFVGHHIAFTNGPNGITTLDRYNLFGYRIIGVKGHFFLALGTFAFVLAALYLLNESRTGRAWRALREDPLAAELLSIPVNRLKLLAFVFGAATAGLAGTVFASFQDAVFPSSFGPEQLILVYAMVILGGSGSLAGVALGAVVVNVAQEALRSSPENARYLFYILILIGVLNLRPWRWAATVLAGAIALGFAVHAVVAAAWPGGVNGDTLPSRPIGGGSIANAIDHWVLLPKSPEAFGKWSYVVLVLGVIALTQVGRVWRKLVAIPLIYLGACVWENVLVGQPAVTRLILLGVMLIVLMAVRPEGLLGTARVEIV